MKTKTSQSNEADSGNLLSPAVHNCKILVVEDSASSRDNIEKILRDAGYQNLEFACDGVEAIEKVSRNEPDLMILDIVMPRLDGFKVCNWIRSQPNLQSLPILVQTALNEPEQRVSVFTVGATDMVSKPVNAAELLARVKIHLENMLLLSNLQSFHERVESELTMARDMQSAILSIFRVYGPH
ncbi:MAG: response regulator [Deltaproteobacteria bacterium]|jgi:phosphoserine phosphatase RsbU/P|nr:response regulator [Deltaproteobacteria bacterium]